MKMKEENENAGLKFNIKKTKVMASGPITSWELDGGKGNQADFTFLGSQITVDSDCSHETKRCLLFGRKNYVTSLTKVHIDKVMVFPVVMYGCESWTIKKTEGYRIDAFQLWCWRRLFRVP